MTKKFTDNEKSEAKEIVRAVTGYANSMSHKSRNNAFVEHMTREHRTLQQSFTRMCVAWLEALGTSVEGHYDARNEGSVKLGQAFVDAIPADKRHLPFI